MEGNRAELEKALEMATDALMKSRLNPNPEIRNPKFEIRDSKPEIRNPKFETRNTKPRKTRVCGPFTRNP